MNALEYLTSTQGRLAPKSFALGVLAVWVAGLAAQSLLSGEIMDRAGMWPFVAAQIVLIWIWLVLHIKRLRDAGQGAGAAYAVALIYLLAIGLMLMLVAFFTNPTEATPRPGDNPAGDAASSTLLVLFLILIMFKPDFGVFTLILKGLILITFLPAVISFLFSVRTALRKRAP